MEVQISLKNIFIQGNLRCDDVSEEVSICQLEPIEQEGAIRQMLYSLKGIRVILQQVSVLCFFNFPHCICGLGFKFPEALVDEEEWEEMLDKQSC